MTVSARITLLPSLAFSNVNSQIGAEFGNTAANQELFGLHVVHGVVAR
jgi:hypothetical protein